MATSAREGIAGFLQELGRKIGETLELDQDGSCILETETGQECVIGAPAEGHLFVTSTPLVDLDPDTPAALLVELLALNADLGRTGGATIGLERDDHLSTLHQVHSSEGLDQARFEELLEGFMAIGEDLRHEILRLQTVAATNRAEPVAARPEGDPPLGTRV